MGSEHAAKTAMLNTGSGVLATYTYTYLWLLVTGFMAPCDRMDPLCRQRHLWGYWSRTI